MSSLQQKVAKHDTALERIAAKLTNITTRLELIESKIESGNSTRSIILILVAAKVLFEGVHSIDWAAIGNLLRTVGG